MALQGSGQISIKDLDREMLDPAAPHALSEFYRTNGLTPDTRPGGTTTIPGNLNPPGMNPPSPGGCTGSGPSTYTTFNVPGCAPNIGSSPGDGPYGNANPFSCGNHTHPGATWKCQGAGVSQWGTVPTCWDDGTSSGVKFLTPYPSSGSYNLVECHEQPITYTNPTPGNPNPGYYNPPQTIVTPPVAINGGVPQGGQISLSDFYGATKT